MDSARHISSTFDGIHGASPFSRSRCVTSSFPARYRTRCRVKRKPPARNRPASSRHARAASPDLRRERLVCLRPCGHVLERRAEQDRSCPRCGPRCCGTSNTCRSRSSLPAPRRSWPPRCSGALHTYWNRSTKTFTGPPRGARCDKRPTPNKAHIRTVVVRNHLYLVIVIAPPSGLAGRPRARQWASVS